DLPSRTPRCRAARADRSREPDLDGERQLLRLDGRLRFEPEPAPVPDAVLLRERRDRLLDRLRLLLVEIRAAPIKPFVALQLLGPVARQVLEEVLARAGSEKEQIRPDTAGS